MTSLLYKEVIPIAKLKTPSYQGLVLNSVQKKYPYLLIGITVLVIAYLIFSGFLSRNKLFQWKGNVVPTKEVEKAKQETYVVKHGDDLWKIAEATYGSGYNAYDIAKANKIKNPNIINAGQELVLPSVAPRQLTKGEVAPVKTQQVTITGKEYTVQHGDYLWKIALEAYGDGYAWVRIANANHLTNPNLIHAGNVFIVPR